MRSRRAGPGRCTVGRDGKNEYGQVDLHVEIVKYRDSKAGSSLVRRIECVVYYSNCRDRNQHRLLNLPAS